MGIVASVKYMVNYMWVCNRNVDTVLKGILDSNKARCFLYMIRVGFSS